MPQQWPHEELFISREETEKLDRDLQSAFIRILVNEDIPVTTQLRNNLKNIYLPLAAWIARNNDTSTHTGPELIGINGAQGSGKSTLTKIVSMILQEGFHKTVVKLSIDDFYKTRLERQQLAKTKHPLFMTRGVPGTHDIQLALSVIYQLRNNDKSKTMLIPVFDKAADDRAPEKNWRTERCQPDIILLEGWCVGARAGNTATIGNSLAQSVNTLEATEDANGEWRNSINQQLAGDYALLFALLDKLVMLKIPDFDKVLAWRTLQEDKLRNKATQNSYHNNSHSIKTMTTAQLQRFVMHYERITKAMLKEMPGRADLVLGLDDNHQITHVTFNQSSRR